MKFFLSIIRLDQVLYHCLFVPLNHLVPAVLLSKLFFVIVPSESIVNSHTIVTLKGECLLKLQLYHKPLLKISQFFFFFFFGMISLVYRQFLIHHCLNFVPCWLLKLWIVHNLLCILLIREISDIWL